MTDNQSEGRWGGINPARVVCKWAWQRSKSPCSLALIVTDNHSEGRWGGINPARVVCKWAWQRSKSPCELRHLSLQNLSPQKYTFGKIATPRQNGSSYRAHLQDRGRIRNSPEDGVPSPALPGTSKRVVLMAKARIRDLVVFLGRNSSRVYASTVGPERVSTSRIGRKKGLPGLPEQPLVTLLQPPDGTSERLLLTGGPPDRGRSSSRGRERCSLLGKASGEEGVDESSEARKLTPRPSGSKLGTVVQLDGPSPKRPPTTRYPPGGRSYSPPKLKLWPPITPLWRGETSQNSGL